MECERVRLMNTLMLIVIGLIIKVKIVICVLAYFLYFERMKHLLSAYFLLVVLCCEMGVDEFVTPKSPDIGGWAYPALCVRTCVAGDRTREHLTRPYMNGIVMH